MRRLIYLLLVPALACRPSANAPPAVGEMAARWTGSAEGAFRAPASALWCVRDTLLELFAVRNDTAVGFVLLPKDSLAAGVYSIFSAQTFIAFRPQATAAARWLDQVELKGFEGTSGVVTLSEAGATGVSGSFEVSLRRSGAADTLMIKGSFAGVPVGRAIEACGRANRPGAG
jgi:hypothetical protein